ncbi:MAG: SRPBCC family protein [Patescibacteria group bacterium]
MAKDAYKAEIVIGKTIEQIFGFVSDLRNLPFWSGASDVEVVSESPSIVGNTYEVIFSTFFTKSSTPVEITEYTSPNSFSFRDNSKQISFIYTFESVEDGTKVSLSCEFDDSPFSFSHLKVDKLLADLKKYLEAQGLF